MRLPGSPASSLKLCGLCGGGHQTAAFGPTPIWFASVAGGSAQAFHRLNPAPICGNSGLLRGEEHAAVLKPFP